jgi:hypothetical protein
MRAERLALPQQQSTVSLLFAVQYAIPTRFNFFVGFNNSRPLHGYLRIRAQFNSLALLPIV